MGWLARSRLRRTTPKDRNVLKHGRILLILGVAESGLFLALGVLTLLYPGNTESPIVVSSGFFGFACLGACLIGEFLYVRYWLEPSGLRYRTWVGGRGFLRWDDVVRIRYSETARWFRMDGAQGEIVRVSELLDSISEIARAVLQFVPRERIDLDALYVLKERAAGSPPSNRG